MRRNMIWVVLVAVVYGLSVSAQKTAPPTAPATPAGNSSSAQAGTSSRQTKSETNVQLKLGPPQTSPRIKNPRGAQAESTTIALLRRQRQAADAEAAQIKLWTVQKKATGGATIGPTHAASQSTSTGRTGSGKPVDTTGNSSSLARESQPPVGVLACLLNPTMRIINVAGKAAPATFTSSPSDPSEPDPNFYTITGCGFGNHLPNTQVWIHGQDAFHQDFQIQEWNDNGIALNLNPALRGLLDHDNLTLVVQRADGTQAKMSGFKFYATRETVPLKTIPQNYVMLGYVEDPKAVDPSYDQQAGHPTSKLLAPPDPKARVIPPQYNTSAPDAVGFSAEATRYSTEFEFRGTYDYFDFSKLAAEFTTDSMQGVYWPLATTDCSDWDTQDMSLGTDGPPWSLTWDGDNIRVVWQESWCNGHRIAGADKKYRAQYALQVWVRGPRGVDPWTAKPN